MGEYSFRDRSAAPPAVNAEGAPARCPACQSPAIMTTSTKPGADSYWRCKQCGEVWNQGRRQPGYRPPPMR